jgi:hypothetical protein
MDDRIGSSFRIMVAAVVAMGVLVIAAACFAGFRSRWEWLLVAAAAIYLLRRFWFATARMRALDRQGFFTGQRVGARWVYEEVHYGAIQALELPVAYVGRGAYELLTPGEEEWRTRMPPWARERRAEITDRLAVVFGRSGMRVVDVPTSAPPAN